MNLMKIIKQIKNLKKTDSVLFKVMVELFRELSENDFKKIGITIDCEILEYEWVYRRNKKTFKKENNYYDKISLVDNGKLMEFLDQYEEYYDSSMYKKCSIINTPLPLYIIISW